MYHGSTDNYQKLFSEHSNHNSDTKARIRDLEARVEKLELVCESLWEMLKAKHGLTDTDLIEHMAQIDLMDGSFDGTKKKTSAFECKRCGRKNSKRHSKCMYCGEVHLIGPFE